MSFTVFAGIVTAAGLFAVIWFIVFLRTKGESFTFDPGGKDGEFGQTLLLMYMDIAKFVLGLAAASIVFCLFGSSNLGQPSARPLRAFASPLFLVAMSIIYGVLFMIFLVLNYLACRRRDEMSGAGMLDKENDLVSLLQARRKPGVISNSTYSERTNPRECSLS